MIDRDLMVEVIRAIRAGMCPDCGHVGLDARHKDDWCGRDRRCACSRCLRHPHPAYRQSVKTPLGKRRG